MKSRREAREAVVKVFYEVEVGDADIKEVTPRIIEDMELVPDLGEYAERLINAFRDNKSVIDDSIASFVKDYDYDRLAAIDRNIIRMATTEMFFVPEMPPAVTINEAIEISKTYSSVESGKFVNGVLSKLLTTSKKAKWDPSTAPVESVIRTKPVKVEEESVDEESDEAKKAKQFGWVVKGE